MRSALTGLRLRLESISVSSDDPDVVDDALAALDQADRLTTTIDDLLRLARTGRYADAVTFDVTELVRRHLADLQPRVDVSRRSLSFTASGRLRAIAAPGAVGQALDVLLDNALRHGTGRVDVEVAGSDAYITITVCDQGSSLSEADLDELFTEGRLGGVHGIGLPLARTLIEADGGRLDLVASTPAAFRILVPAAPADE
jgi:signal transduction histidine kinase